jgi:hypothetical protein
LADVAHAAGSRLGESLAAVAGRVAGTLPCVETHRRFIPFDSPHPGTRGQPAAWVAVVVILGEGPQSPRWSTRRVRPKTAWASSKSQGRASDGVNTHDEGAIDCAGNRLKVRPAAAHALQQIKVTVAIEVTKR